MKELKRISDKGYELALQKTAERQAALHDGNAGEIFQILTDASAMALDHQEMIETGQRHIQVDGSFDDWFLERAFTPNFFIALNTLGYESALELFKENDLKRLWFLEGGFKSMVREVPLQSLDEICGEIPEFIRFVEKSEPDILLLGFPPNRYLQSVWLQEALFQGAGLPKFSIEVVDEATADRSEANKIVAEFEINSSKGDALLDRRLAEYKAKPQFFSDFGFVARDRNYQEELENSETVRSAEIAIRKTLTDAKIKILRHLEILALGSKRSYFLDAAIQELSALSAPLLLAMTGNDLSYFGIDRNQVASHASRYTAQIWNLAFKMSLLDVTLNHQEFTRLQNLLEPLRPYCHFNTSSDLFSVFQWNYYDAVFVLSPAELEKINDAVILYQDVWKRARKGADQFLKGWSAYKDLAAEQAKKLARDFSRASQLAEKFKPDGIGKIHVPSRRRQEKSEFRGSGIFVNDFREYHPRNKKLPIIRFSKMQSHAIRFLFTKLEAREEKATPIELLTDLYSGEASAKLADGWRLETHLIRKEHAAWKYGLLQFHRKEERDGEIPSKYSLKLI